MKMIQDRINQIWHWGSGAIYPDGVAVIPADDRGFALGDGVFDTLLLIDGEPQYYKAHMDRLRRHAEVMKLPLPADFGDHSRIISELYMRTKRPCFAALRTNISRHSGGRRGLRIPVLDNHSVLTLSLSPLSDEALAVSSQTLCVSRDVRRLTSSVLSRIKSLSYAENVLAMAEATARGYDNAVILNEAGHVSCAANGNIYLLMEGEGWLTPAVEDGCLDGIIRAQLLRDGLVRETRSIDQGLLAKARSLAISNSIYGLVPVSVYEGRSLDVAAVDFAFDVQRHQEGHFSENNA